MFTSANKELYDFFLNKLNANSFGVEFSGNFIFKFWPQGSGVNEFEIIYKEEQQDDINYLTKEVVPVVDIQTIEIPFVEQNKRSDFEKEFYIAVRIEYDVNEFNQRVIEFDEDNPKYQAILETLDDIRQNLTYTYNGFKYTFKVKEPQKVNVFKYSGSYYQIFALNFNASRVLTGFYGNEMEFFLAEQGQPLAKLDVVEADVMVGKSTSVFNEITFTATDQNTKINSRNWQAQVTINYRGIAVDNLIFNEMLATSTETIVKPYSFRMRQAGVDYDYLVYITSANSSFRNNSLETLTFQLERV